MRVAALTMSEVFSSLRAVKGEVGVSVWLAYRFLRRGERDTLQQRRAGPSIDGRPPIS
jgi:hypothetical protein